MLDRNRRTGAIAFGAVGVMFGLIPAVGLAAIEGSLAAIVVGGLIVAFSGALFAFAAWSTYEPTPPIPDTPIARRTAILLIVGRVLLYPTFAIVAVTLGKESVVLGAVLILVLLATQVTLSTIVSRRLQRGT